MVLGTENPETTR